MRRVVISGMGVVSPIGNSVDEMWDSIKNEKCGIDFITHFDTSDYKVKLAAEVKNLDTEEYFSKKDLKFNDRFTQFARIAAKQALLDSKINLDSTDLDRLGVVIASGIGGISTIESCCNVLNSQGNSRVSPFFIPMALVNLAAGSVAIDLKAKGNCSSVVTACAASTNAIGDAYHRIKFGFEDIIFAGGSEASINPLSIAGFQSMRALNSSDDKNRASIPFDKDRSGFVMGEGAGIIVLEEYEHAIKRGAKIYAEIVGYGSTCDASHITAPIEDGSGGAKAMLLAIKEANISKNCIDYINAHGTSTPLNDKTETKAIKLAFEEHAKNIFVSSTKSYTGHLLGASGAIEAIISIKSLQENYVPATINYKVYDEECDLDIVANKGRNVALNYVMSNSLGFGGHNASIIFKKVDNQ